MNDLRDLNLIDIQRILNGLQKISLKSNAYHIIGLFIKKYDIEKDNINKIIYNWLTTSHLVCTSKAINRLSRHLGSESGLENDQNKLFEIGIKQNTPETWKKVFDLASERVAWKNLSSPIVLFSKGLKATDTDQWCNIFKSGHSYRHLQFSNFESHFPAWEILIETGDFSFDELFELWLYAGYTKKLMIKIFLLYTIPDRLLIKFGNLSGNWEDVFKYGHLTRDLDEILKLDVDFSFSVNPMIRTGYIQNVNKLLDYGRSRDSLETWNAIIESGQITDMDHLNAIVDRFPETACTVIKHNLVSDISIWLNWAIKNRNTFIFVAKHIENLSKLDFLEFPLPIKVENTIID
jgi:hypothetical protein